jgi:hypothetical protein
MRKITACVVLALSPLAVVLPAQSEPISEQGLVRSYVETAAFPGKVNIGSFILPAGMRQALSMADLFDERDIDKQILVAYDCSGNQASPVVILEPKPPEEVGPRVF